MTDGRFVFGLKQAVFLAIVATALAVGVAILVSN